MAPQRQPHSARPGAFELGFRRRRGVHPLSQRRTWVWIIVFGFCAVLYDSGVWNQHVAAQDPEISVDAGQDNVEHEKAGEHKDGEAAHHGEEGEHAEGEHEEGGHAGGHSDPVAPVLAAIVLILLLAKIGGDLFERAGMPAVLGELVVGIVLGNFALFTGWEGLEFLKAPPEFKLSTVLHHINEAGPTKLSGHDRQIISETRDNFEKLDQVLTKVDVEGEESLTDEEVDRLERAGELSPYQTGAILKILASIGVILLLFEVGLESTVREMMSVGVSSLVVAVLGVIVPMILGWGAGYFLIPEEGWQVHVFIGATLCATSVGITARVLKDLGRSQQRESQIILGAAVIDDVLGLVVLAIVSGVIQQGSVDAQSLIKIVGLAFGFLLGAILLGTVIFTRPLFRAASYLRGHGMLVASSLVICFGFSWLANFFGLAPIVGAFAAGLILERAHYRELNAREDHELEEALAPLTALLVPIFFVQMGIQVDLASFANPSVWGLAATITIAAIIGKQVCAFGVLEKGLNGQAVGLGMIPRGEVGLIFADVGRNLTANGHPVINDSTFAAVVVMVMITTMVTPPLLKWSMTKGDQPGGMEPPDGSSDGEGSAENSGESPPHGH